MAPSGGSLDTIIKGTEEAAKDVHSFLDVLVDVIDDSLDPDRRSKTHPPPEWTRAVATLVWEPDSDLAPAVTRLGEAVRARVGSE